MFAAIHLPNFSLQAALRNESDLSQQPVAIASGEIIFQTNPPAAGFGVVAGLTASQAQARCGHLLIRPRSTALETTATEILLQSAYHFSACIEETDAGVCTMELKGLGLDGPEACHTWATRILKMLDTFYLEGRVGFAVTPALAYLAARVAQPILVVQNVDEFTARLPVEMLAPPPDMLKILRLWGIETARALAGLGKDCVLERLGKEAAALFDSISTTSIRPLKLVAPPEVFTETATFENGIETLEPLLKILNEFIRQLAARLTAIHQVASQLKLELGLASGEKIQRCFQMPAPTNDDRILLRTFRTYLETLKTDSEVISLSLVFIPGSLHSHQFGFFETTLRNPNQFFETLGRLEALCGTGRIGTPIAEPTHKPDVFRLQKPDFDIQDKNTNLANDNQFVPLRRLRPTVSAIIEFNSQKPVAIRSRVFNGQIIKLAGPYFSSGEWWDDRRWYREEWDVQIISGVCCRVVRSNQGDFIEGVYD
jgi:protein ImuB